jgi:hypothetical protein
MQLRGIIQSAVLQEVPPESGNLEIVMRIQGVGPGQPRLIVIPFAILVEDESLDPEAIAGRAFDAEVAPGPDARWLVTRISFASQVLRRQE